MAGSNGASTRIDDLMKRSQQSLADFIKVELALGTTFAEIAGQQRVHGPVDAFHRSLEVASKALQTAWKFASKLSSAELRRSAEQECSELERRLSSL